MTTADPNYYTTTVTVAVTAYPAATAPTVNAATQNAGRWSFYNYSTTTAMIVSLNGTDDAATIPPGVPWSFNSPNQGCRLWVKLASAGSANLAVNFESKTGDVG